MTASGATLQMAVPSVGAMPARVRTAVVAADPLSRAGVVSQLRYRSEVELTEAAGDGPDVVVVVCDSVDATAVAAVRAARPARVVLVATRLDGPSLLTAVEGGVHGVVRRSEATGDHLARAVVAASAGDGSLPPDLLGRLLAHVGNPTRRQSIRRGMTYGGLSKRELDVLRLLAEGHSTAEIARLLAYSERTIKNTVHELTTRLQLRNRVHAVAYALREGLI
jgi:DNA-binding NarL/FixJ family response regulator